MEFAKVTGIVRTELLKEVVQRLQDTGFNGMTLGHVFGYGEYANYFTGQTRMRHARIELFVAMDRAEQVAASIIDVAFTGNAGDGLVTISPVTKLYRIRTKAQPSQDEL